MKTTKLPYEHAFVPGSVYAILDTSDIRESHDIPYPHGDLLIYLGCEPSNAVFLIFHRPSKGQNVTWHRTNTYGNLGLVSVLPYLKPLTP